MALINCSKCGKQISDKSTNCIHCGGLIKPIDTVANDEIIERKKTSFIKKHLFLILGVVFLFLFFLFVEDLLCNMYVFCLVINPIAKIFYSSIILGISLFIDYIRNRK